MRSLCAVVLWLLAAAGVAVPVSAPGITTVAGATGLSGGLEYVSGLWSGRDLLGNDELVVDGEGNLAGSVPGVVITPKEGRIPPS